MNQLKMNLDLEGNEEDFRIFSLEEIKPKEIKYNVLELFSGAGGMALGLHKAGLNPLALVDKDKPANETLKHNFPEWNIIGEDINELAEKGIETIIKDIKMIDIVTGGFPCQPFSHAGKRAGLKDTRGTVFYSLAKIIDRKSVV